MTIDEIFDALHRCPELGMDLPRTRSIVLDQLADVANVEVTTYHNHSCVRATIDGSSNTPILLRADMDALPGPDGPAHRCGHDAHTAMLLDALRHLAALDELPHPVIALFQAGEETGEGARALLDANAHVYRGQRAARALGLHVMADVPVGTLQVRNGPMMRGRDVFWVTFAGRSGHAALPDRAASTVGPAARLALAAEALSHPDPHDPVTVTVTELRTGGHLGVIPDAATVVIDARTCEPSTRERLRIEITALLDRDHDGVTVSYQHRGGGAVVNDRATVDVLVDAASGIADIDWLDVAFPASEDFHYISDVVPAAFAFLGAGRAGGPAIHADDFRIDTAALPIGAAVLARFAVAGGAPR